MAREIHTGVQLYRHLMRVIKQLPEKNRSYYRHNVRQQFKSHSDETDPERIQQIIQKALEDGEWIQNKYKK